MTGSPRAFAASALSLWPEQPAVDLPFRVELQGQWAAGCMPTVESVWIEGRDIHFNVREQTGAKCATPAEAPTKLLSAAPGESTLIAREAGVYRVQAHAADSGKLLAFALARIGDDPIPTTPESGLWWPEPGAEFANSGPGFGVQVEMQGEIVALTATGYLDDGRASWWFGAAPLVSNLSTTALSALTGGSAPFGRYAAPKEAQAAGRLHVEWISSARAVFWFERVDPQTGAIALNPISMVRFAFGIQPGASWSGTWVAEFSYPGTEPNSPVQDTLRKLQFGAFSESAKEFVLTDATHGYQLQCRRDTRRTQSPPSRCSLRDAEGTIVAEFDDIGLNRMQGFASDRRSSVRLLRLNW